MARIGTKAKLFALSTKLPFVGETADPWIFVVLGVLTAATLAAVASPQTIFPHDKDARSHVLQVAAGLLVVLGAYFTAVNIREVRAQQAFERVRTVIDQLASPSEAVRVGAVHLLEHLALEQLDLPGGTVGEGAEARRRAISAALAAVAAEPGDRASAQLARRALERLPPVFDPSEGGGEKRVPSP